MEVCLLNCVLRDPSPVCCPLPWSTHTHTHTHSHNQCFFYTWGSMRLGFCRCCCLYCFFVRGQVSVVLYPFSPSKLCSMYVPVKFVCLCHINTHLSNKSMYACFAF